ncbi:MAG: glycyl radical protein [Desulfobacula sp.]|nr:glycyl radical protein [Desulfobacula sp.]
MGTTERTTRLKNRCRFKHVAGGEYVDAGVKAGVERARLITQSHKENIGEPNCVIRAKGLENILSNITVHIQDDELIVGANTEHPDYFPMYPELSYFATLDMVESQYCDHKDEMREITEYWKPYTIQTKGEKYFTPEEIGIMYSATTIQPPMFVTAFSSIVPTYESVLEDGLLKRIEEVEKNIANANASLRKSPWNAQENLHYLDKLDQWKAMVIAMKAVVGWAQRHARLAKIMAENFLTDAKRKEELLEISDICRNVPANPARGLRDAMQSKWFTYLLCHSIERYSSGYGQKEDKLLWPYFQKSVIEKSDQPMSREEAVELFECERLKVSEHGSTKGRQLREFFAGSNDLFILTLGGINPDGSDASNDCTNAILEATESIITTEPSISFRWNEIGNTETKQKVFNCIKKGFGFPSIKNDEMNTQQLIKYFNVPEEVARDWALVLCMSPGITGRRGTQKTRSEGGSDVYPAKVLEIALTDGFDEFFSNIQLGPKTGDGAEFKSFEDVWNALKLQLRFAIELGLRSKDVGRIMESTHLSCPFISSIDDGCVEKGMDANALAEVPNPWHNIIGGSVVVIDSMTAIKQLVFDEKKYTMAQLVEALRNNWEGKEEMRIDFWNAPKFGNDDAYADAVATKYYDLIADEWKRNTTYSGTYPLPLAQSVAGYIVNGPKTAATANGRHAGEALDDGGSSPYMGCDKNGPTAVLKSASKINASKYKGILLNQRLSTVLMNSDAGFDLWHAYMKTWHSLDIDHVQFNVISQEDMKAAQIEPEKYTDTLVRIAGYSAKFIDLARYSQDTIIARTEQDMASGS